MGLIEKLSKNLLDPSVTAPLEEAYSSLRFVARGAMHRGNAVECPCCGGRFRNFLLPNTHTKRRCECPRCRSYERHRMTLLYLRSQTDLLQKGGRMLHVAPERILQPIFRGLPNVDYVSIDLFSPMADVRMDLTKMYFQDQSFDWIMCSHVLEHIPDDRKAMAELLRVLKPGGAAILLVPINEGMEKTDEDHSVTDPRERLRRWGQEDHVRVYGRDYYERLKDVGFEVTVEGFAESLGVEACRRYGLAKGEKMILGKRPGQH